MLLSREGDRGPGRREIRYSGFADAEMMCRLYGTTEQ